jgi:hypothetical protein
VEKNDRNMKSDFTFTNNFVTSDCSWTTRDPGSHTDGIQWGGARNVVVKNNTILINICADHVSNSAIGGWAELGNVNSSVIDHNLLSGGGKTVYMQSKDNFTWGSASFTNNVFDRKWSGGGTGCGTAAGSQPGLWGGLYGSGLPKSLVWSGNTYENGASVTISQATGC